MRIAFFSDIHANLPALEAVLADIKNQAPDFVFCLGDLVGYNIWPNEVATLIRQNGIPTLAGNYDYGIGRNSDDCGCAYKSEEEKAWGKASIRFTNQSTTDETRRYLRNLPRHMQLDFESQGDSPVRMLMVHGSPRRINEYLHIDRPAKSLRRMMSQAQAHIMLFGHTHIPYHRVLEEESGEAIRFRHAVNIGSVGKPKDGDPRACYAILEWDDPRSLKAADDMRVQFRRVQYELEKAAKAVEESALPDAYADMLRTAR